MNFFTELFANELFKSTFWAWFICQLLKTLINLKLNHTLDLERMIGSGGMPSAHSAAVTSFATTAGFLYGPSSFEFIISLLYAIIVMYDARGVRLETGNQAKVLNHLIKLLSDKEHIIPFDQKLQELVGHTPLQVLVGSLLGFIISICFFYY